MKPTKNQNKKEYLRGGKASYFASDTHLRTVWYLYNGGQLKEKLTDEIKEEINKFVRESGDPNLWEIK